VLALLPASARCAEPLAPPKGGASGPYVAIIAEAAQRFGLPNGWIAAVLRAESGGDPHAVSPKGALGLMQLMPQTWSELRARYGLGGDVFDPHDNIIAGAAYLRELFDRYGAPGCLAAYNAGPARYDAYRAGRQSLPAETLAYIAAVAARIDGRGAERSPAALARHAPNWTAAPLFAAHQADGPVAAEGVVASLPTPSSRGLFAALSGAADAP
jgi:soluble lytic murein transglycosylase-like protein